MSIGLHLMSLKLQNLKFKKTTITRLSLNESPMKHTSNTILVHKSYAIQESYSKLYLIRKINHLLDEFILVTGILPSISQHVLFITCSGYCIKKG